MTFHKSALLLNSVLPNLVATSFLFLLVIVLLFFTISMSEESMFQWSQPYYWITALKDERGASHRIHMEASEEVYRDEVKFLKHQEVGRCFAHTG